MDNSLYAQDNHKKLVKENESNLKKKTSDHFIEQRALSKCVTNLELEVAAERTQREDAVSNQQYHVLQAVKEAKATERHHFKLILEKEKASCRSTRTKMDHAILDAIVSNLFAFTFPFGRGLVFTPTYGCTHRNSMGVII